MQVSVDPSVEPIRKFIAGRYTEDERATIIATADSPGSPQQQRRRLQSSKGSLPLVHVIIPASGWKDRNDGLDGIAIDLPALQVKPADGGYFPLNIQIKDPLWAQRNLLDFSFSVKPNEARTLWLDTRDRILPEGKAIYLTIAGAGADFGPASLNGARIRLIFKPRAEAVKEHELDRFTQARDSYAMLIEEHTNNPKLESLQSLCSRHHGRPAGESEQLGGPDLLVRQQSLASKTSLHSAGRARRRSLLGVSPDHAVAQPEPVRQLVYRQKADRGRRIRRRSF